MLLVLTTSTAFADMRQYQSPVVQYFIDHPDVESLTLYDCTVPKATTAEEACKKLSKRMHKISRAKLFDTEHYWPTDIASFQDPARPADVIIYHEAPDAKVTSGYTPSARRFSLPRNRYFIRQYFEPLGIISR